MSVYSDYIWKARLNALLSGQKDIKVATDFHTRVDQINKIMGNDSSALLVTMVNFMVESATVDYRFETGNTNFNEILVNWKKSINKNVNPDIPRGLRSVTQQYLKERWNSSLIVLNIKWGLVDNYEVPINLWLTDGGQVVVDGDTSKFGGYEYLVGRNHPKPIERNKIKTFLVRKPFEQLYTKYPSPYLVKRGALKHALIKDVIINKQADLINSIVPHILLAKVGSDKSAQQDNFPTEEELINLKDEVIKMTQQYDQTDVSGKNIGAFPHDVSLENLIPDLTKFLNSTILNPSDKNILASLGLIELEGFSKSRQETILNPKVMVEEVVDAVLDWREMLNEISLEIVERNKKRHPKIDRDIKVIPGVIKSFLTSDDKVLIRSAFDRGTVGHQDFCEILPFDFETTLQRRIQERDLGVDDILYPHKIMNQEAVPDGGEAPEEVKEESPEKKKTEKDIEALTHEIEDISKLQRAEKQYECECLKCGKVIKSSKHCKDIKCSCGGEMRRKSRPGTGDKASYKTIDDLPKDLKASLSIPEQIKYVQNLNK